MKKPQQTQKDSFSSKKWQEISEIDTAITVWKRKLFKCNNKTEIKEGKENKYNSTDK